MEKPHVRPRSHLFTVRVWEEDLGTEQRSEQRAIRGKQEKENEAAPRHIATAPSVVHRLLLTCGVVGPVLFNGAYLVEGATRPVYDAWRQAASALSLGDGGWMQIANFIVFGLLTCTGLSICSLPS